MKALVRNNCGTFKRFHEPWSLDNFDDGYFDGSERFRVYLPNHPRAYKNGYVIRAIVAYEAYHGEIVSKEFEIHHKNENRLDDSKGNLQKLTHSEHRIIHQDNSVILKCQSCLKPFSVPQWRINQRIKEGYKIKYCSNECSYKIPKKTKVREKRNCKNKQCGIKFETIPSARKKFCSRRCNAMYYWKKRKELNV